MTERKRQLAKAAAIGVVTGSADLAATTVWMHRSYTHKAYELAPPLKTAARTIIWGTGIIPRVWAGVHRKHHDFADVPGDPHSPVLQGRYGVPKVISKNPFLYRNEAKVQAGLEPAADLKPDKLDKLIFDKPLPGLAASLAGHVALNKKWGNPGYMGVVSFGIEKIVYVAGGNFVNAIGHGGKHPFNAIATGEIQPNDDGTYGADSKLVGALTLGEGNQRYHHDHPEDPFFGPEPENLTWNQRAVKDLGGTAALAMIEIGLAHDNNQ